MSSYIYCNGDGEEGGGVFWFVCSFATIIKMKGESDVSASWGEIFSLGLFD